MINQEDKKNIFRKNVGRNLRSEEQQSHVQVEPNGTQVQTEVNTEHDN